MSWQTVDLNHVGIDYNNNAKSIDDSCVARARARAAPHGTRAVFGAGADRRARFAAKIYMAGRYYVGLGHG